MAVEDTSALIMSVFAALLLEWLTVYDLLGVTYAFGDEGWRHDAIEHGISRLTVTGELLEIQLNHPDDGE